MSGSSPLSALGLLPRLGLLTAGDALVNMLMAAAGRPVDRLYSRVTGFNGQVFPHGWGDLSIVNFAEDVRLMRACSASDPLQVSFELTGRGRWRAVEFCQYEATFRTPCTGRMWDALPPESRTGRVRLLLPVAPGGGGGGGAAGGGAAPAGVVHLAATGDQGLERRTRLAVPLLEQGVAALVLESPFYGARRPAAQRGSKLRAVSDLLALGWATIFESLHLLNWMRAEGIHLRGVSGLSMGGVHSCMTAGIYHGPVAVAPLLAPRSAAVAYVDGPMVASLAWEQLASDADAANNSLPAVVAAAAQAIDMMREASYAVALWDEDEGGGGGGRAGRAGAGAVPPPQAEGAVAGAAEGGASGPGVPPAAASRDSAGAPAAAARPPPASATSGGAAAAPAGPASLAEGRGALGEAPTGGGLAPGTPPAGADEGRTAAEAPWRALRGDALLAAAQDALTALQRSQRRGRQEQGRCLRRLKQVLEVYTDTTRYPRPQRPDAAVLVAATNDAYVSTESVRALHAYWPGSELRLVEGGHVSAFLFQRHHFRSAVLDSLARLAQPPPPPPPPPPPQQTTTQSTAPQG